MQAKHCPCFKAGGFYYWGRNLPECSWDTRTRAVCSDKREFKGVYEPPKEWPLQVLRIYDSGAPLKPLQIPREYRQTVKEAAIQSLLRVMTWLAGTGFVVPVRIPAQSLHPHAVTIHLIVMDLVNHGSRLEACRSRYTTHSDKARGSSKAARPNVPRRERSDNVGSRNLLKSDTCMRATVTWSPTYLMGLNKAAVRPALSMPSESAQVMYLWFELQREASTTRTIKVPVFLF
ncbi:hypothetical protein BJ508DRAFT_306868 [Ascobolus immersus RN42]|uniref:Uncharacterized protein n=1 Tax=Ascobolus immersus RN42 TaxID=1160509 RepID=A0A3N4IAC4_ASCIM|nr:hypothetical protein BJ508DRAFT_306868 [Ascobolus immersus RN42]